MKKLYGDLLFSFWVFLILNKFHGYDFCLILYRTASIGKHVHILLFDKY